MKISLTPKVKLLSTSMIALAIALLVTQAPVGAVTAQLAQANLQQAAGTQLDKVRAELQRRQTQLTQSMATLSQNVKSGGATTPDPSTSGVPGTGGSSQQCTTGDKNMQQAVAQANSNASTAGTNTQTLITQANQPGANSQQLATSADSQYNQYQQANMQTNILNSVCTQKDAQAELQTLIKQATDRYNQCFGGNLDLSQNSSWTQLTGGSGGSNSGSGSTGGQSSGSGSSTSGDCPQGSNGQNGGSSQGGSGSGSGSNSGSSGSSSSGGTSDLISKIIQLVAAVAAIIASIVALVLAIQKGDYAAAATIAITIIGQLENAASILLDGKSDITSVLSSLGVSTSGTTTTTAGGSSGN